MDSRRVLQSVLFILWAAVGLPAANLDVSADTGRIILTRIAPDFAIVTEIDNASPVVGQQFSVLYRLRAVRAPVAVDIDPQQFAGLWTEVAPVEGVPPLTKILDGRQASEYLLRQVIAFPLSEGTLRLPPLRLKIRTTGSAANSSDWDLVCVSDAVSVQVSAVPDAQVYPLVGNLDGNVTARNDGREALLELAGTANLAFLDPLQWLQAPAGVNLWTRPLDWEKLVQTRDLAGKRTLTLLQRRRWAIGFVGQWRDDSRLGDMSLRVYHPPDGWEQKRIAGITVRRSEADISPMPGPRSNQHQSGNPRTRALMIAGALVALLAAAVATARAIRNREIRRKLPAHKRMAALHKTAASSSRSFLDSAHKVLERYAEENGLLDKIGRGETSLDRCWNDVERLRFSLDPPSDAQRSEIVNFVKKLPR